VLSGVFQPGTLNPEPLNLGQRIIVKHCKSVNAPNVGSGVSVAIKEIPATDTFCFDINIIYRFDGY